MIRRDKVYNKSNPSKKKIKPHRAWVCPEIRTVLSESTIKLVAQELPIHVRRQNPHMSDKQIEDLISFYVNRAGCEGRTIAVIAISIGERIGSRESKDLWAWWMLLILFPDKYSPDYETRQR